jgi:enamine deaminase RidA (YjgF/YER057c/UK114 family)
MNRRRAFSGVSLESQFGYCRAIRVGNYICVSGTAPITPSGITYAPGNAYDQTRYCLEKIQKALQDVGANIQDVIRTRIYVTDISRSDQYGKAHQEFFGEHPPAATMVEVQALVDAEMLVEIEVDAICDS